MSVGLFGPGAVLNDAVVCSLAVLVDVGTAALRIHAPSAARGRERTAPSSGDRVDQPPISLHEGIPYERLSREAALHKVLTGGMPMGTQRIPWAGAGADKAAVFRLSLARLSRR